MMFHKYLCHLATVITFTDFIFKLLRQYIENLFILFDLEIAFLFPWAVALKQVGVAGLVAVFVFLAILVVGFVYEWKKGALDWE